MFPTAFYVFISFLITVLIGFFFILLASISNNRMQVKLSRNEYIKSRYEYLKVCILNNVEPECFEDENER